MPSYVRRSSFDFLLKLGQVLQADSAAWRLLKELIRAYLCLRAMRGKL